MKALLSSAWLIIISTVMVFGQRTNTPRGEWSLAYFNRFGVNPGARVGYAVPVWTRQRASGSDWSLLLKSHVGFYSQPRYQTGAFVQVQIGFRRTSVRGFFIEPPQLGVGYLHAFLNAPTYTVDANGAVSRTKRAGNPTLMLPYVSALGVGYRFPNAPVRLFMSVDGFLQYPVNGQFVTHASIPVGISVQF